MKVHWTKTAEEHLNAIHAYIALDSPEYARHMVDRLTNRSVQIAQLPMSGCKVPEYAHDKIREVVEKPYRIIYYTKPKQIDILAVVHSAMELLKQE